jgi:hypothetical protein
MPRQLKVCAVLTFLLAVVFYLFFQISKHNLTLLQVNAFAEDPYDAVGSCRAAMVVAVFMGFGCLGVLLGYSLLAKPLGLFRHVSE